MNDFALKFHKMDDGQWFCRAINIEDDNFNGEWRTLAVTNLEDESGNDVECRLHNPSECASYLIKELKELYEIQ